MAMSPRRLGRLSIAGSAFAGFCFPPEVIVLSVLCTCASRCRTALDEELPAERGIDVDHTTVHRWVQRFTPLLTEAARPCQHCW
jgi:transposase-like protein